MPSDFNEMIDEFADNVKNVLGPFSGLFNPKNSQAAQEQVAELKERIANQDRTINILTGATAKFEADLNTANIKLTAVTLERDALREQISLKDKKTNEPNRLKKP